MERWIVGMERWIVGLGCALLVGACSSSPEPMRVCTPGGTQSCTCGTSSGSQVCNGAGSAFGVCMCAVVDAGMMGTDAGMSVDTGSTSDPVEGTWCMPVSGWTTANVYTFGDGSFVNVTLGDIPISESTNAGCHVESTLAGSYVTDSGILTLTHGASTEERTGCASASNDGAGPGPVGAGTEMIPFSVGGGVLTFGSGPSAVVLTPC